MCGRTMHYMAKQNRFKMLKTCTLLISNANFLMHIQMTRRSAKTATISAKVTEILNVYAIMFLKKNLLNSLNSLHSPRILIT